MTTFNTGNKLGSMAPEDLLDNAQNLDFAVNDKEKIDWTDRRGQFRKTWSGIEIMAINAAANFGYDTLNGKSFLTGATVNLNELLLNTVDGSYYKWTGFFPAGGKVVPANSTVESAGGEGQGKWLNVGSASLRASTTRFFGSVAEMQQAGDLFDGCVVITRTFSAAIPSGGASYRVSTDVITPNGKTTFALRGGLYATLMHNGSASLQQAGVPEGDNVAAGLAIPYLKAVGVKDVIIPNSSFSFNGNVDISGMALHGNNTIYSGGNFFGGRLDDVRRAARSINFPENKQMQPIPVSKSRLKLLVKCTQTPNGIKSPNDELYAVFSPSSFGGLSVFFTGNGQGEIAEGNAGAPFDRMRVWNGYLADGYVMIRQWDSVNPTSTAVSDFDYLNIKYGKTLTGRWAPGDSNTLKALKMEAGSTATFTVPAGKSKSNVAVYATGASAEQVTVTVNGNVVKTFSAKDTTGNKIAIVDFDVPCTSGRTNTIVISTTGTTYVFGVDVYDMDTTKPNDIPLKFAYNHRLVVHGLKEITNSGIGASIDTVMVDDASNFCGSYHGGDVATEGQCYFSVDTVQIAYTTSTKVIDNSSLKLSSGEFIVGRSITARYAGILKASTPCNFRYVLDFGVDGGCNVTYWYTAKDNDVNFRTLYDALHCTSRDLNYTPTRTFAAKQPGGAGATDASIELTDNEYPIYQYGSANNQLVIQPTPAGQENNNVLSRLWDNVNYIKYYYTSIANAGAFLTTLKKGYTYSASCLYQYGANII